MLTDELERQGFALPVLGDRTRERLKGILPAESSVLNPIDCLPSRTGHQMRQIFQVMREEESGRIDVIAIQVGNPGMHPNREIYREVSEAIKVLTSPEKGLKGELLWFDLTSLESQRIKISPLNNR